MGTSVSDKGKLVLHNIWHNKTLNDDFAGNMRIRIDFDKIDSLIADLKYWIKNKNKLKKDYKLNF